MSGLLLIFALIVCVVCGVVVVRFVVRRVRNPRWKTPVMLGLTVTLISALFVDEVIGKYQFEALCKANGIESADVSKARGKKVKVDYGDRHPVSGVVMPMMESDVLFHDAGSGGEVLIQHKNFYAMGGWLMRYTPLSMGSDHPMLFAGNGCGFLKREQIFKLNQISEIN